MKRHVCMALFLASGVSLVVAEEAADSSRLRNFELQRSIRRIELPSEFTGAALGVGKPPGLSSFGTWTTSDFEPDDFSTFFVWCDFESVAAIQVFNVGNVRTVKVTVKVTTDTGAIAFTDAGPFVPDQGEGFYILSDPIGKLAPGSYKVTVKVAQGDKSIGGQQWILVVSGDDPFCQPAAAPLRNRGAALSKPRE